MQLHNTCILSTLLLSALIVEAAVPDPVLVLTKENFDETIDNNSVVVVKFFDPRCGHCKKMAPAYVEAAKKFAEGDTGVILADVDATAQPDLADKFEIRAYPTLKLFLNKKPIDYTGGRSAEAIIEWVTNMMGPALEFVETLDEAKQKYRMAIYAMFDTSDSDEYREFEAYADNNRGDAKFVATVKSGLSHKIYAFHEGETPVEKENSDSLKEFIKAKSFPLFGPIHGENYKNYVDREKDMVWFCGERADFDNHKPAIREVAAKHDGFSFVWLDSEQFKGHAEMSLGLSEFPGLVLQKQSGRYILPSPAESLKDSSRMITFLDDVMANKIERSLKSEAIPTKNDEPVKLVVGKNFEEVVMSADHDVLLEVYAPWCGHCQNFEPIYKDFATKMLPYKHIVVAKMDGTANESPVDNFDWPGFPTIFFVKAGEKTPMKYDRSRSIDDLVSFVKENSSKPLEEAVPEEVVHDEL